MEMWRYQSLGEEFGPVPTDVLEDLLRSGTLSPADLVCREGEPWRPAKECPELQAALRSHAPLPDEDQDLLRLLNQVGGERSSVPTATGDTTVRQSPSAQQWFTEILGQELGPLDWEELTAMVARGELSPTDRVRRGPSGEWYRADDIVGLFPESVASPLPLATPGGTESTAAEATWFVEEQGRPRGPLTYQMLRSLAASGRLGPRDRVREGASGPWLRAATLPGLFSELTVTRTVSAQSGQTVRSSDAKPADLPESPTRVEGVAKTPAAVPAGDPVSSPKEAGHDEWTEFFETVEARERRKWRRESTPVTRPPAGWTSSASPAAALPSPAATSSVPSPPAPSEPRSFPPVGAPSPQTPPPSPMATAPPPSPPAFVAPPRPKRSLSLPALNLSGFFANLKGASGGGWGVKLLIPLAIVLGLAAWQFLPGLLGGTPGREFYEPINQIWQQVIQLHTRQASPEDWKALAAKSLPVLDEAQQKLAPIVASQGIKAPLAQRLLWMVDQEDGPTRAKGYLRKVLDSGGQMEGGDIMTGNALMSEAASFLPR